MNRLVFLCSAFALFAGCEVRSFPFFAETPDGAPTPQPRPDGGLREGGPVLPPPPDGASLETGAPEAGTICQPSAELCNGADDDCDGLIDEDFDFNTDDSHCGRCGNACALLNGAARCSVGRCRLSACNPGFVDLDRLEINGCECALTAGGQELCDGVDNDCDGLIDEDFDLEADPLNCGGCGRACAFANAGALCENARCVRQACVPGFVDLDGAPQNGCEYACTPSAGGLDACDGQDNDCDGATDESDPLAGRACFPTGIVGCDPGSGACGGGCALGTWACLPGGLVCQNAKLPEPDVCDGQDNDCDGATDEDFDLQNDPRFCGACTNACALPNAINGCAAGACRVAFCKAGFVDLDAAPDNGCEYACSPDGPEVCDGRDNDCNGKTDEADPGLRFPPENFCLQTGECGKGQGGSTRYPGFGSYPVCTTAGDGTAPDWYCNYPASVELFAPNQVLGQETWCDGLDNDCDAETDEHTQPRVGTTCKDEGLGACQKDGVLRCQADRLLRPACDVSAAPDHVVVHESCDGLDNDCDGLTDEPWDNPQGSSLPACQGAPCLGVRDDVIHVTTGGNDYFIHRFEASRPDATADDPGKLDGRACALGPAHLPWTSVSYDRALAACEGAGMRLCRTTRQSACSSSAPTADEWGFACAAGLICPAPTVQPYPYGCGYTPNACNGLDAARASAAPVGAFAACAGPDLGGGARAFDLSGNVAEWTTDCRGVLADGRRTHTLRGGSYLSIPAALACGFMATVVGEDFAFVDTGFRCCSGCPQGLADCEGACVSLGSDGAHCGACGTSCEPGQRCDNGRCR
ncbi:MAG: SUMF1/EgtB/PvdO family nonheme iron enzyme [Myxococcales bacterium]|nr:SUMF1/EgtB/PvdO family nonheme iron enzyme [Myxococcales bacterium]